MKLIRDPNTGDPINDLLIVSGVSAATSRAIDRDVAAYTRSLTREQQRERIKITRAIMKRI